MKISITEEMKFRQKVVEYAIKHNNNAKTARRYKTSRQQVQRWRKNMTVHCSHQQTNPGVPIASKPAYGKGNRAFEQEIWAPQA